MCFSSEASTVVSSYFRCPFDQKSGIDDCAKSVSIKQEYISREELQQCSCRILQNIPESEVGGRIRSLLLQQFAPCATFALLLGPSQIFVAKKIATGLPFTLRFCFDAPQRFRVHVVKGTLKRGSMKVVKKVLVGSSEGSFVVAESGIQTKNGKGERYPLSELEDRQAKLDKEMSLVKRLSQKVPHLLEYRKIEYYDKTGFFRKKYQSELYKGDLVDYVNRISDRSTSLESRKKIIFQIVETLRALHQEKICHLDMKLDNIILDQDCAIKLCDFGFAVPFCDSISSRGSVGMIPPEMFHSATIQSNPWYDMWSLGVIIYQLTFIRNSPFFEIQTEILQNIRNDLRGPLVSKFTQKIELFRKEISGGESIHCPSERPRSINHVISDLLSPNPVERPTAEQVFGFVAALRI